MINFRFFSNGEEIHFNEDLSNTMNDVSEIKEKIHPWTFPEDIIEDVEFEDIPNSGPQEVPVDVQDTEKKGFD